MSILVHVLRELGIDSAWALTMSIAVDAYQRGLLYVECDVHSRDRKDLSFLFVTNIFRHLFPRDLIFLLPQPDSKMIPVLSSVFVFSNMVRYFFIHLLSQNYFITKKRN